MYREIPTTAVEVQTGLWANARTLTLGSITKTFYDLYSAEGYCFYDLTIPENWVDGEVGGELVLPEQRMYAQYQSTNYTTVDQINADIVSVPVQDGYEIVSVGTNTETI